MFKSTRGGFAFVIFNPVINLIFLVFIILILINEFFKFDPPGLLQFYIDVYLYTFFPIVLSFIVTPMRISEEGHKRGIVIAAVVVRICVPLILYIFMHNVIIDIYSDIPSAITKKFEYAEDFAIIAETSDTLKRYSPNTIKFVVENKESSIDTKDYNLIDNEKYKVVYLKHSKHIIDIIKIENLSK